MKIKTEGKWMWEEPDQPKPATGEWTARTVMDLGEAWDVAGAHNAELRNAQPFLDDALKQLAGERELRKRWERKTEETFTQLAAEQKKREQTERALSVQCDATMQLEAQLAAEQKKYLSLHADYRYQRETNRQLVDALTDARNMIDPFRWDTSKIDAALAKIGGK